VYGVTGCRVGGNTGCCQQGILSPRRGGWQSFSIAEMRR
jgi:hypothetical protein